MLSTCQVYTSQFSHTTDLYKHTPGQVKLFPSTRTPDVHTIRTEYTSVPQKHTTGLYTLQIYTNGSE